MSKLAILVVDDDTVWLRILYKFFTLSKYKVYTAATCAEGLKLAELHRPDCILLDFQMRDGNGGEACLSIRSNENIKMIPVIMVSAYPEEEANAYFDYKTDGFVLKGTKLINLKGIVETIVRRVRWERGVKRKGDIRLEAEGFKVLRHSELLVQLSPGQFRLFQLLLEKSPDFVSDDVISKHVFNSDFAPEKLDAIRGLAFRLRQKLGRQLGRRIKNKSARGWVYVQPRLRSVEV